MLVKRDLVDPSPAIPVPEKATREGAALPIDDALFENPDFAEPAPMRRSLGGQNLIDAADEARQRLRR